MGKLKFLLLSFSVSISTLNANAQDIGEAYRFSNLSVQGTARSIGFGNALGSVGGDFSALSVNPAGLGIYRRSELTFTPGVMINSSSSQYAGVTTADNNTRFNINNFGIVLTSAPGGRRYRRSNWKAVSFAFGMNRVADFNRDYSYHGYNNTSSASQAFESDYNLNPNNITDESSLSYAGLTANLIDTSNGVATSHVPFGGGINQAKSIQQRGGINEFVFSVGGNFKEKLMLGATLGISSVNYSSASYYTESLADGNTSNPYHFNYFSYGQSLGITGTGVTGKFGAIYKVSDFFRVGAAFHTPTYYYLHDVYTPYISSDVNRQSVTATDHELQGNVFDYQLATPWKGVLSAAFLLKKIGFITADYEYVDYSAMHYYFPPDPDYGFSYQQQQDNLNHEIKNIYKAASNFRVGAEVVLSKYFMLRSGFGFYGSPYKNDNGANAQRIDISGGIGFHFSHFFTDLGYMHSLYQAQETPYSVDFSSVTSGAAAAIPVAKTDFSINTVSLTVGVKF